MSGGKRRPHYSTDSHVSDRFVMSPKSQAINCRPVLYRKCGCGKRISNPQYYACRECYGKISGSRCPVCKALKQERFSFCFACARKVDAIIGGTLV
jgi:hypothetical protein